MTRLLRLPLERLQQMSLFILAVSSKWQLSAPFQLRPTVLPLLLPVDQLV